MSYDEYLQLAYEQWAEIYAELIAQKNNDSKNEKQ